MKLTKLHDYFHKNPYKPSPGNTINTLGNSERNPLNRRKTSPDW